MPQPANCCLNWPATSVRSQGPVFPRIGRYIVTGSFDGTARLWDSQTGKEKYKLDLVANRADWVSVTAAFSPDGARFVTARAAPDIDRGAAQVWDTASGRELARLTGSRVCANAAFSSDGRYVITANADGTASVYQVVAAEDLEKLFPKR